MPMRITLSLSLQLNGIYALFLSHKNGAYNMDRKEYLLSSPKLAISNFMDSKLKISIIIFLLLFVELYPARVNSSRIRVDIVKPPTKVPFQRQLMKVDTDDYKESDYNHRNDQGKGKPHS
ncbi:hypothetical protein RIF29_34667 [Crotalaria pallida]|uniref:Transmembrane protein n=1 Tax=Crotalaria pallida TaxID=3830 RepID=A0AAN9HUS7_CROPI